MIQLRLALITSTISSVFMLNSISIVELSQGKPAQMLLYFALVAEVYAVLNIQPIDKK
jgi:hypothetical protein